MELGNYGAFFAILLVNNVCHQLKRLTTSALPYFLIGLQMKFWENCLEGEDTSFDF
jgi:hypothetical protein